MMKGARNGLILLLVLLGLAQAAPARACGGNPCIPAEMAALKALIRSEHVASRNHFGTAAPIPSGKPASISSGRGEMGAYQNWLYNSLWIPEILPAMMEMTKQLATTMMQHTFAIGVLIDAKTQLETQTIFQDLTARAYKDYQPSAGMCVFGTNVRSLAATDRQVSLTRHVFSQRMLDRQLNEYKTSAAEGRDMDRIRRTEDFKTTLCDRFDNGRIAGKADTGFAQMCSSSNARANGTVNADIDFVRTVMLPSTLNIDMKSTAAGGLLQNDEVFALASNLYGHDVINPTGRSQMQIVDNQSAHLDVREIVAKRAVAESVLDNLVALKSKAATGITGAQTAQYMSIILKQLGVPDAEIPRLLGTNDRPNGGAAPDPTQTAPSYYAQMEILAKRLYQRPEFYTELYDTPVNVNRKSVAMQAIGLMLDRDIYESHQRNEALLSVLLELRAAERQNQIEDTVGNMPREN